MSQDDITKWEVENMDDITKWEITYGDDSDTIVFTMKDGTKKEFKRIK